MSGCEYAMWRPQHKPRYFKITGGFTKKTTKIALHLSYVAYGESDWEDTRVVCECWPDSCTHTPEGDDGCCPTKAIGPGIFCRGCRRLRTKPTVKGFSRGGYLTDEEYSQYAGMCKYRAAHFGHGWRTPPIFRFIEFGDMYLCILRLLLRVVGAMWARFIGKHVTKVKEAEALTNWLHGDLHIYVPPIRTSAKTEKVEIVKALSVTGEEACRLVENMPHAFDYITVNAGEKAKCISCIKYFIAFWNELNNRPYDEAKGGLLANAVKDEHHKTKADSLWRLGRKFVQKYIIAADAESAAPYIKCCALEVYEMALKVNLVDVSGQALELLNQFRKHCLTTRGGGKTPLGSLMVRQLGAQDAVLQHVKKRVHTRATYYQRTRMVAGHTGKQLQHMPERTNSNMGKGGGEVGDSPHLDRKKTQ
jgi:hypothetical protein